ncbi:HEAT repeat domain-containing protein [Gordonia sp. (in: high G+C Gram-positive bacteria)]|uniref:HEAT repeat domain-containing protein n=1 Tax=Gordonia sp. (in: high G+C Gram-positive bacteria) TaxID=84139 RepID=UPI0039E397C0
MSSTYPAALAAADPSVRLRAALHAGSHPDDAHVGRLVQRCAVETDFYVRDMLTWALTRHSRSSTIPLLESVLSDDAQPPQAHAQALHTLSKLAAPETWPAITPELLRSADDEVARAAWRAAVEVVPDQEVASLADELAAQLGSGDVERRRSLSRALVALGESGVARAEAVAATSADARVVAHAAATVRLALDPDAAFADDVGTAWRLLSPDAGGDAEEAGREDR